MNMRKLLTAAVLATGIAAFAGPAFATVMPVYGHIDVSGGTTSSGVTSSGGVTTVNFSNPGNVFSVTGAFSALGTCTGCAGFGTSTLPASGTTTFSSNTTLPFTLFTAENNSLTAAMSITSATFSQLQGGGWQIYGVGDLSLTGYATSLASYSMTIPSSGANASIDIYTQTPEPSTLALFGAGLLGCAFFVGRRRRSKKLQA